MATIPATLIGLAIIIAWAFLGFMALGYITTAKYWLEESGNYVRVGLWVVAAFSLLSWAAPPESPVRELAPEFTGIAITVALIDELGRYRARIQYKRSVIKQMGSMVNDAAREAVRLADMEGWLEDGSLEGAFLAEADLSGARLWYSNFSGARFMASNLRDVRFNNANLEGANLMAADLRSARMMVANLAHANFAMADLRNANLMGANLSGAWLQQAKLEDAHLGHATLLDATLSEATYNRETRWPSGFDPLTAGAIYVSEPDEIAANESQLMDLH